jgi:hypothetical protein
MQRQRRVIGWVGLGLLGFPLAQLRSIREREATVTFIQTKAPIPSPDPCEAALRAARVAQTAAVIEVNQEEDELEAWDPRAAAGLNPEEWHEALMAEDRSGHLRQARAAAARAGALAHSPAQARRIAEFLALIEHEAGHHALALHYARRMAALDPQAERGRRVVRSVRQVTRQQRRMDDGGVAGEHRFAGRGAEDDARLSPGERLLNRR